MDFRQALTAHRDTLLEWLHDESPQRDINLGGAALKDVLQVASEIILLFGGKSPRIGNDGFHQSYRQRTGA